MSKNTETYVVALSPDDAEQEALEYSAHDDILDAVVELKKLDQPDGKRNPYKIFKIRELYECICEVELEARERELVKP